MEKLKSLLSAPAADPALVMTASLLSMSGKYLLLPLAIFFPVLWLNSRTRAKAGLLALVYYSVALRELPAGISAFLGTETLWKAAGFFCILVTVLSAPFFFMWAGSLTKRMFLLPAILFILTVPPLGILGLANPLFAAGAIFPGAEWLGFPLAILLIFFFSLSCKTAKPRARFFLGALLLLSLTFSLDKNAEEKKLAGWKGVYTGFKFSAGKRPPERQYSRQAKLVRNIKKIKQKTVILPETAFGKWTSGTKNLWRSALKNGWLENKIVVGGGEVWNIKKRIYENALVQTSPTQKTLYVQRVPVPWNLDRIKASFKKIGQDSAFELSGKKIAPLICYESYILCPFLETMLTSRPDAMLVTGNQWWSKGLRFAELQLSFSKSLAMLFNLPVIVAVNNP